MSESHLEREAREWIEEIVGVRFESSFAESLNDGSILCRLVQTIYSMAGRPVTFKINDPANFKPVSMASKKRENITNAITAIRALGMKEFEMFGTVDLYEEKNIPQVVNCIHALGRLMQSAAYAGLGLPKLGVKVVEKNTRTFTEAQLAQARGAVSILNLGSSKYGTQAMLEVLDGKAATVQQTASSSAFSPAAKAKQAADDAAAAAPAPAASPASAPAPALEPAAASPAPEPAAASPAAAPAPADTQAAAAAAVPKAAAAGDSLPPDWEELKTEAGLTYYYNAAKGVTSWDRPGAVGSSVPAELPAGWQELLTPEGQAYYFEAATGTTSWERPAAAGAAAAASGVAAATGGGAGAAALPPGWQEATTADGQTYYIETATGTTQWERPTAGGGAAALPPGWTQATTTDGQTYYIEAATGTTQWERPS